MKRILIADANKASLVMTSEVFKDHFPGVQVVVARTSAECLELVKTSENIDAYVIDFDLPDRDGAWTAARIKKQSRTPVLITAFDRPDVHDVIEDELAAYDDCLSWLRKPVKAETVVAVAQRFCEGKYRTQRRLAFGIPALAEIVITTTITRTIKETVKVPVLAKASSAAAAKAASSKAATQGAAKGKTPVKKAAAKAPAFTTKIVTRTVTEKAQAKTWVPATVTDTSLGGIKIDIDFSGCASAGRASASSASPAGIRDVSWSVKADDIFAVHIPSAEALETGDLPRWKEWQQTRLNQNAKAGAGTSVTASSKAAPKDSKGRGTLSTLSAKTLKSAGTAGEATQTVRGRVCWTQAEGETLAVGLEIDSATQARRIFDIAAVRYNLARKTAAATTQPLAAAATSTAKQSSLRGGRNAGAS